jgi:hypothetical protein
MAPTAPRLQPAAGDLWRFAVGDRLRDARFEETRRLQADTSLERPGIDRRPHQRIH